MKLLIAGSRVFNDYKYLYSKIEALNLDIAEIISGLAKGADTLAIQYSKDKNIPLKEFPANWQKYGKKAGILRNKEMGNYSDIAIIFWNGYSKGTKHMIDYMKDLKKPIFLFLYNSDDLIRYNSNLFI